MTTAEVALQAIDSQVAELLSRWRSESAPLSSSSLRGGHPALRELIALGATALPAVFRDLERTRDGHLSKALTEMTGGIACSV